MKFLYTLTVAVARPSSDENTSYVVPIL